jgi:type I restriction enzyme S subunit
MGNIQNGEITVPESGGLDTVPDSLLLENNDLLFTRTNGNPDLVGKVGIFRGSISDKVSFASYLVRLRPNPTHKPEWLHSLLNCTAFWPFARGHALVNLQTNLNSTRYVQFLIPVPPPEEQQNIVNYIKRQTGMLDNLSLSYARQIELLTEYRAALIHECVTGQRAVPEKIKEN